MPENLFSECFDHSELRAEARDANDIYKQRNCFFENALLSGHFHECAPLPSDEDLFNGKIYPEFLSTPYSPQEFAEQVKGLAHLEEDHEPHHGEDGGADRGGVVPVQAKYRPEGLAHQHHEHVGKSAGEGSAQNPS